MDVLFRYENSSLATAWTIVVKCNYEFIVWQTLEDEKALLTL